MIRFIQRHRRAAALLHRVPLTRAWMSRRVWAELEATPGFNDRMRVAEDQLRNGGGVLFEDFGKRP